MAKFKSESSLGISAYGIYKYYVAFRVSSYAASFLGFLSFRGAAHPVTEL